MPDIGFVAKTMTIAVPEGTDIEGVVTFQRMASGELRIVAQPCGGAPKLPAAGPYLLRWLADALDIDLLEEVPDAD